ncbi:MAG: TIGR03619 family F420-dependent LLM class oxidoreductase, partial [Myxococcota bacterium]|nr:TIGR03619 family F420-dependent LLM class oxidoreductase [Myxococcota bacterium]
PTHVKLGLALRTMGPQATAPFVAACARAAEAEGADELWVPDHLAIPPDDAEGSEGHYLDPLATLAYLAAATEHIGLGTGVLNLPYRPALPTAKWVATIQELSGGRLRLGVGVGWMRAEFRALGVERRRRGALTDETLAFLRRCLGADAGAEDGDVVESHGQPFLFRPRPPAPPVFVGGGPPHALERAARLGEGWMPVGAADPEALRPHVDTLQRRAREAGRGPLEVVCMTRLPLDDAERARELLAGLAEVGVTRVAHGDRVADAAGFARMAGQLVALRP